jgi:hypothetical protein
MQFGGVLPPDAPDPRLGREAEVAALDHRVLGLRAQPSLEDWGALGLETGADGSGAWMRAVTVGYTLWRNPADRDDPANLAELDDDTRRSLDQEPPWPRPPWILDMVQRMRYPMLWEAVRTSWHRDASELSTLPYLLAHHANHVLMNRFREELGLEPGPTGADGAWRVTERNVNPAAQLDVDGERMPASEIDTDPFVYAIGVRLDPTTVATVVVPRDELPFVDLALATRTAPGASQP